MIIRTILPLKYLVQFNSLNSLIQIQDKETIFFLNQTLITFFLVFMILNWFLFVPETKKLHNMIYAICNHLGYNEILWNKNGGLFFYIHKNIYQSNLKSVLLSVAKVFLIWGWNIVVSTCLFFYLFVTVFFLQA